MESTLQKEMFFFIADISGYTAYMIQSEREHAHGTLVISTLMKALVKEASLPMEISKLEGDAIFLFLPIEKLPAEIQGNPFLLTERLMRLFSVFAAKIIELQHSTACGCGACSNIQKLNLKVVGHLGKAEQESIGAFQELSGVDVILVHRLLKNQVKEKCYLMLTKAAAGRLPLPKEGKSFAGVEQDKDIGEIPVVVYYFSAEMSLESKKELTFFEKLKSHIQLGMGTALLKCGLQPQRKFRNFPK